jgi:23S rRNA (adenine1618-N6)-methyltransferase
MHPKNPYCNRYDFKRLVKYYPLLQKHVISNPSSEETIDFSSSTAVYALNKAILLADFKLKNYDLPMGYLIPPVPGRLDYLLNLRDFLLKKFNNAKDTQIRGLDIGAGANGIYCILGAQYFNWKMVGIDCDAKAVEIANTNIQYTKALQNKVKILHQENKSFLFKNIIQSHEQFDFMVCNPPFHSSKEEAVKGSLRKINNLGDQTNKNEFSLNFQGQANELWCNGGEVLFIKRLIKESVSFKDQVKVFSSLVAKVNSLSKIEKQLNKVKANYHIKPMALGNKKGRYVMWWFEINNS